MKVCPDCKTEAEADASFCPECGRPLGSDTAKPDLSAMMTVGGLETVASVAPSTPEQATLEPGTTFADRYVIGDTIGRGGMGIVYRAEDTLTKSTVALKLIRPERLSGASAVQRLISEGATARDIRHPNVVAVYDVGDAGGQPFVSMECLDGVSLRSWHREKVQKDDDVSLKVAARIMTEILHGLDAAHKMNVIHRDLKPENVILMAEPTEDAAPLKILDFGIALAAGANLESGTGTGLGTPRYMAPEQITNPDTAGPSADLYSLSTMFYELLVDVLPQGHWQPPSGGRPDVPAGIDALIEKGLSNRPKSRPQSATDYLTQLDAALGGAVTPDDVVAPEKENDQANKPQNGNQDTTNTSGSFFDQLKENWEQRPLWQKVTIGAVVALVVIGAIYEDETGDYEDFGRLGSGDVVTEVIDTNDKTVTPQAPSPFPALNGQWNDGYGTVYAMSVGENGDFSGSGLSPQGYQVALTGSFNGSTQGNYTVSAPTMGLSFNGSVSWDKRDCHIRFRTIGGAGTSDLAGSFHVNHAPGEPCP